MANWTTEWTTHPDYPGWRKRRLVDPKTGMQAMLQTLWERIPGSDPNLPGPPGAEGWGGIFPRRPWPERKPPSWGKLPEWLPRPKQPPYRPPSGTHEMPGIPDELPPLSPRRPPFGTHEMPGIPDRSTRPPGERVEPDWWKKPFPFFPKWKDRGIKPMPMPMPPRTRPGIWDKFPRRKFDGNEKDFLQLLKDAQVGSAMPKYHSGQRKNIRDLSTEMATDPLSYVSDNVRGPQLGGKQRISDLPLRSATQGDSMSDHLAATYGEDSPELRRHEAQDAGIELPKGRDWITKMHDIQSAYFTGADFGYEEFWPQRLGVTNEMIDMFMAVPEEALQYAMDNPTDAVLQEFEEYYGFPLNVNDPDMQKYFGDRKKKRPRG